MPYGLAVPFEPKSGWRSRDVPPELAIHAALWESTGSEEMSRFQMLSAGKTGQPAIDGPDVFVCSVSGGGAEDAGAPDDPPACALADGVPVGVGVSVAAVDVGVADAPKDVDAGEAPFEILGPCLGEAMCNAVVGRTITTTATVATTNELTIASSQRHLASILPTQTA